MYIYSFFNKNFIKNKSLLFASSVNAFSGIWTERKEFYFLRRFFPKYFDSNLQNLVN